MAAVHKTHRRVQPASGAQSGAIQPSQTEQQEAAATPASIPALASADSYVPPSALPNPFLNVPRRHANIIDDPRIGGLVRLLGRSMTLVREASASWNGVEKLETRLNYLNALLDIVNDRSARARPGAPFRYIQNERPQVQYVVFMADLIDMAGSGSQAARAALGKIAVEVDPFADLPHKLEAIRAVLKLGGIEDFHDSEFAVLGNRTVTLEPPRPKNKPVKPAKSKRGPAAKPEDAAAANPKVAVPPAPLHLQAPAEPLPARPPVLVVSAAPPARPPMSFEQKLAEVRRYFSGIENLIDPNEAEEIGFALKRLNRNAEGGKCGPDDEHELAKIFLRIKFVDPMPTTRHVPSIDLPVAQAVDVREGAIRACSELTEKIEVCRARIESAREVVFEVFEGSTGLTEMNAEFVYLNSRLTAIQAEANAGRAVVYERAKSDVAALERSHVEKLELVVALHKVATGKVKGRRQDPTRESAGVLERMLQYSNHPLELLDFPRFKGDVRKVITANQRGETFDPAKLSPARMYRDVSIEHGQVAGDIATVARTEEVSSPIKAVGVGPLEGGPKNDRTGKPDERIGGITRRLRGPANVQEHGK